MEEKLISADECQLINIEGKTELESHHFATTRVKTGPSVDAESTSRASISTQSPNVIHR